MVDVRMDQLCPGLPQRLHNEADEANLRETSDTIDTTVGLGHHTEISHQNTWDFSTLALSLSHMADTSRPSAFSWNCGKCKNTSEENIIYPHPVSLCPELIHEPVHPLLVQLQRLGRVGQVGAVDHVLENLDPVIEIVEHEDPVASDLLGLQHGLEVGQQLHVLAHVGGQHHVYHHLPDGDPLLVGQAAEDVTGGVLEQLEGHGQVMILQDSVVIVHQSQV